MPAVKENVKDYDDIMADYDPARNMSWNIMTKYEKTTILGLRMEQLARGAQSLLEIASKDAAKDNKDGASKDPSVPYDPYEIALQELVERKLPFMIARTMPNGQKEYWKLKDMVIR
jgi:DNA-directed RNA polymerase I, II, and III subunit RPABC2